MSELTTHEVSKDLTKLREQMKTHQAKYEGALDRFRADMDSFRADMSKNESAFERLRTDMAQKDTALERFRADMVQRESNRMQWLIGIWIGGVLVTIAVLGILIRLST